MSLYKVKKTIKDNLSSNFDDFETSNFINQNQFVI